MPVLPGVERRHAAAGDQRLRPDGPHQARLPRHRDHRAELRAGCARSTPPASRTSSGTSPRRSTAQQGAENSGWITDAVIRGGRGSAGPNRRRSLPMPTPRRSPRLSIAGRAGGDGGRQVAARRRSCCRPAGAAAGAAGDRLSTPATFEAELEPSAEVRLRVAIAGCAVCRHRDRCLPDRRPLRAHRADLHARAAARRCSTRATPSSPACPWRCSGCSRTSRSSLTTAAARGRGGARRRGLGARRRGLQRLPALGPARADPRDLPVVRRKRRGDGRRGGPVRRPAAVGRLVDSRISADSDSSRYGGVAGHRRRLFEANKGRNMRHGITGRTLPIFHRRRRASRLRVRAAVPRPATATKRPHDVKSKNDSAVAAKLSPDLQQQVADDSTAPVSVLVALQASAVPQAKSLLTDAHVAGRKGIALLVGKLNATKLAKLAAINRRRRCDVDPVQAVRQPHGQRSGGR